VMIWPIDRLTNELDSRVEMSEDESLLVVGEVRPLCIRRNDISPSTGWSALITSPFYMTSLSSFHNSEQRNLALNIFTYSCKCKREAYPEPLRPSCQSKHEPNPGIHEKIIDGRDERIFTCS
jgi:hypothetical protein